MITVHGAVLSYNIIPAMEVAGFLGYNFIYTNLIGRVVLSVVYARRSLRLSQTSTLYAGVSMDGLWQPWSVSYARVFFDQRMLLLLAL